MPRLRHVRKLFDLRNSIIHPKAREYSLGENFKKTRLDELHAMPFQHLKKVFWTVAELFELIGDGETPEGLSPERS